jgi:hypothetical protein
MMKRYIGIICLISSVFISQAESRQIFSTMREKAQHVYTIAQENMRSAYQQIKEHKKLVAGIIAYFSFESVGYCKGWRTPLYRLFVLPSAYDTLQAHNTAMHNTIQSDASQAQKATNDHQKELKKKEDIYQELLARYQKLEKSSKDDPYTLEDDFSYTHRDTELQRERQAHQELQQRCKTLELELSLCKNKQEQIRKIAQEAQDLLPDMHSLLERSKDLKKINNTNES